MALTEARLRHEQTTENAESARNIHEISTDGVAASPAAARYDLAIILNNERDS